MQLPVYTYQTNAAFPEYEFVSEGPKGSIKKLIRFTQIDHPVFAIGLATLSISRRIK
jgi:hypothetical protein